MTRGVATGLAIVIAGGAVGAPTGAAADRDAGPAPTLGVDACARGTRWRGRKIDLDVNDAVLSEVFRFLADVGNVNVVVGDDVAGKVTIRLKRVPWDQVLCTVAATRDLSVDRDGTVYLVRTRKK